MPFTYEKLKEMYDASELEGHYEMEDGTQYWFHNNMHHREDGPAVITPEGLQAYWEYGRYKYTLNVDGDLLVEKAPFIMEEEIEEVQEEVPEEFKDIVELISATLRNLNEIEEDDDGK